jgi:phosphatidylserine/phosphatidylglycerophosphate/cardiolipin synthase-like enzyme
MQNLPMYPTQNQDTKPKFKRDAIYLIVIALLIALCGQFYYTYHYKPLAVRDVTIYYNQDHQLNSEITKTIQDADKFVYFGIYTFTREDIRDALLAAKYRGLDVRGIIDRKQSFGLDAQQAIVKELQNAGIRVVFNDHSYIMHLKTVVTDKGYVSGSYNWTAAATNLNDEIVEVGRDEDIRKQYERTMLDIIARYENKQP